MQDCRPSSAAVCSPAPLLSDTLLTNRLHIASGKREKNLVDLRSLSTLISIDKPAKPAKLLILYLVS